MREKSPKEPIMGERDPVAHRPPPVETGTATTDRGRKIAAGTSSPARRWAKLLLMLGALALPWLACGPSGEEQAERAQGAHANLNAVLWTRSSAEHAAATLQAFASAKKALDAALEDSTWTAALEQTGEFAHKPPAVILDVDETVLDNTEFQVGLIEAGIDFDRQMWNDWVFSARSTAVPGALDFCTYAADRRVAVYYVTSRPRSLREATRRNLSELGFPVLPGRESLYTREEERDKGPRRAAIAERHRVLLLVGDKLSDFVSGSRAEPARRGALVAEHAERWGTQWILIPNPMYGDWERALYEDAGELTDAEKLERKRAALRSGS